ncbi:MAG: hypothetical protein IT406_01360 [Candidatus Yanofskybacteria bacterium]|nr:hypothetical protein [Candidatus Yanofskybacteria bacterium]
MEREWQLPPTVDRMEVNAALTVLTERFDADAARLVITAFQSLPADTQWRPWTTHHSEPRTTIGGETREHGTVEISETSPQTRTVGGQRMNARLGSFRVFRIQRPGCYPSIWFRPFWESGPSFSTHALPDEFQLIYDTKRRVPIELDRYEWQLGATSLWDRIQYAFQFRMLKAFWIPIITRLRAHAETMYAAKEYEND